MIQIRFMVSIGSAELVDTGTPGDFVNMIDSSSGSYVGFRYNITTAQFELYEAGGTGIVEIPFPLIADQYTGFIINVRKLTDGSLKFDVYNGGTFSGSTILTSLTKVDTITAGALHTHGDPIDRKIRNFTVGSAPGKTDLFDDGNYSGGTIVPPFAGQSGTGLSISGDALHIVSALGHDSSGNSTFLFTPPPPPPPPPIPPPSGPDHIYFVGDSEWKVAGPKQWHIDGWDLDRLTVPYRGDVHSLDAFLDSFNVWDSWGDDTNMFLADLPSDDHKTFPTVRLTFQGKRKGNLPPDRHQTDTSIQETSGIVFSDAFILTFGLPPHWTAKITYISPVSRFTTWARAEPDVSNITAPVPPDITPDDIVSLVIGGIDYSVWRVAAAHYGDIVAWVLQWFFQRTARYNSSQEVIPSQYWRAQVITQTLLLPVQEEIVS